jgi:hypothetical protein
MTQSAFVRPLAVAAAFGAAVAAVPRSAGADLTKMQCVDANAKSQELRRDGKFLEARELLRKCADASCPAMVRDDCTRRLDDFEKAQPSLVFDVKDGRGADVIDVRVTVDGRPLADRLDGTPLKVNPGAHVFSFQVAGHPAVVDTVLVREGEVARHERVVVGGASAAGAAPGAPAAGSGSPAAGSVTSGPEAAPSRGLGTQRTVGLVLGGAGVAALGAGTIFWISSMSAWSSAKQACGGNPEACTDVGTGTTYHDKASTDALFGTISFVAGGALLAAGGVLFFTGPRDSRPAALVVSPSFGARSAGLVLRGGFQ